VVEPQLNSGIYRAKNAKVAKKRKYIFPNLASLREAYPNPRVFDSRNIHPPLKITAGAKRCDSKNRHPRMF
jgi:hypothetical protein